jgi:ABC-2 type transport system ATP-binding protein
MIETDSLTKRYGDRTAVSDVSFSCEAGTVTGFLGPNGAGKSTTLKMICGLALPTSGSSRVAGSPFHELPNPGRRVGVLIDAAAAHAGRRGRETLAVDAQLLGVPGGRVDELLTLVDLDESAGRKRVKQYSLGMRQRLGIAHALLGDPQVLILDEPANGLDPEGMRWMRGLLRDFADRGGTVLLSSHLLHEVEAIADRLVIISGGALVAQGTRDELLGSTVRTRVRSADDAGLHRALSGAGLTVTVAGAADAGSDGDGGRGGLIVEAAAEQVGDIALSAGVALRELRGGGSDTELEDLFFKLTAAGSSGDGADSSSIAPQEVAA